MKKHLALVLALVMVLGSFSFVSAAPDFSDVKGTTFENAVNRLELLNVLKGYPDGTFKPEGSITRAEFAAVAVRVSGLEQAAMAAKGLPTGFSDVPAWHWASGYVGTAAKLGIVQGVGNGMFAPEAPVKYEEAITMLVRALGYEPEANVKGGYPFGYLIVANDIDLLDGAMGTQGIAATRGFVAKIADNALEIPMMIQVGYGTDTKFVVSGRENTEKTYLLNKLGVDEFEGIVMSNFRVGSKLDENEIVLFDLDEEKNTTLEVTDSVDVDAILGFEVTAWAKDDVIFATTIETADDMVAYDSVTAATDKIATLKVLDDDYDWAVKDEDYGNATVYVNNKKVDAEDAKGFGRIVMNDDDEIVFAYLYDFDDYGVVTEIDKNDMDFVSIKSNKEDTLALDDAEDIYVFTNELSKSSIDNVKEDVSVFYWVDSDDNYFMVAFDSTVKGELEQVVTRNSKITIDEKSYSKAVLASLSEDDMDSFVRWNGSSDIEAYVDEAVTVYLDVNGEAMLLVTDDKISSDIYGLVTWVSQGRTDKLTVFNGQGEEVEYSFKDRLTVSEYGMLDDVKDATTPAAIGVMVELNKDAEITNFVTTTTTASIEKDVDKQVVKIDDVRHYITKDTVVLKAYNSDGKLKPSVIKFDDIVKLKVESEQAIYLVEGTSKDLALLVFTEVGFQATDKTKYAIATGDKFVRGDDYKIELDVAGEGKSVYTLSAQGTIAKGDLVEFSLNSSGEAVIDVIHDMSELTQSSGESVDRVLTNYIETSSDYRVVSETIFYKAKVADTTANPLKAALDGTTSFARIKEGSRVLVLSNEGEAMVVLDLTPFTGATPAGPSTDIEFSAVNNDVTVTNVEFDTATTNAKNSYVVKATGDVSTTPIGSDIDTLVAAGDDLEFNVEVVKSGFYNVQLIRVADEKVIATGRVYLVASGS